MKRLVLARYTGAIAADLKVARRLARKLQTAQRNGQCVLVDCEDTEPSQDFLDVLLKDARQENIKFCGLPIMRQITMALRVDEKEGA